MKRMGRLHAVAVVTVAVVAAACGSTATEQGASGQGAFWEALRVTGDEAEGYPSLESMAEAAGAVVVGRLTRVEIGRTVQGDAPEDLAGYALTVLTVDTVLMGSVSTEAVPLEFLLAGAPQSEEGASALAEDLPEDRLLVFLRAKRGAGEAGLYRAVNSLGLWTNSDRAELDAPLAEGPPQEEGVYAEELAALQDLEAMISYVDSLSGD